MMDEQDEYEKNIESAVLLYLLSCCMDAGGFVAAAGAA